MNCSHCNQVLAASAKFCNHCGTAQNPAPVPPAPSEVQPQVEFCEQCQAPCKPQAKFCLQCGHRLAPAAASTAAVPAQAPLFGTLDTEPTLPQEPPQPPEPVAVAVTAAPTSAPAPTEPIPSSSAPQVDPADPLPREQTAIHSPSGLTPTAPRPPFAKWGIAAAGVVLLAGLAWMALKPSPAPRAAATNGGNTPAAHVPEDAHDDRAKAGALVGPTPIAAPTTPATAAPLDAPLVAPSVSSSASAGTAVPIAAPASNAPVRAVEANKPAPSKPVAAPQPTPKPAAKPNKNGPTLNDLLD